jgi:pyroglutamyl-peptidase
MNTVLVTGFEPFGDDTRNPSQDVARQLDGVELAGHRVAGRVLPCAFGDSLVQLRQWLGELRPKLVLCCGLAAGRVEVTFERVAINIEDARIPDNRGFAPVDRPVLAGGPAAYFTTLPIKAMVQVVRASGILAGVSNTAGTFVCNHVFYGLMHALRRRRGVRGGFVHLPCLPKQTMGGYGLELPRQVEAVRLAVGTAIEVRKDVLLAEGWSH